ncbi:PucR family transcriptional regulator [Rhodococcoides corynebacterioides]|uniref:Helix-turn-helix domain-containing protein n=1 Tax=Rhodococcoides corynebacterioides TaxID=53972 RepID=A0ABS7P0M7_9NOCA|nr:helix-turn-helix domain-containing protein [Rhodococcus corynebacterioides]MBY6365259.1 helix-turn-helix domain-containing protein [Rhodococcus corynebacterioides]MBY6406671.1 helix-turn-helix domain-containing protein [Rhodococcus corynebacterioides]
MAVTLDDLQRTVHAFADVVVPSPHPRARIAVVTLADADDLAGETAATADLYLLAGVGADAAAEWLARVQPAPVAVLTKATSPELRTAAHDGGVALLAVHPRSRWDRVLSMVRGLLDHTADDRSDDTVTSGADTDLYELARTVAAHTHGLVSIEDEHSHVLAYSATDDQADELRRLSILGREGPAEYLRRLESWGVYDAVRRSDEVVDVPGHPDLGIERRLVAGIRSGGTEPGSSGATLVGTLWVQEGRRPLTDDAGPVVQGAAAVAARLIARRRAAPTTEAMQIHRLLGLRGGGVDVPSLAAALSLPDGGPAAVIGLTPTRPGDAAETAGLARLASSVRLHASAFHRSSLVTASADRIYVLLPRMHTAESTAETVTAWTGRLLERLDARSPVRLRAAVAVPVDGLAEVAAARGEVDRVLDGTSGDAAPVARVTTLASSRTPVLLAEIARVVAADPTLRDPRLDVLVDYDRRTSSELCASVAAYLRNPDDVRRAAAAVHVHPNTLRYRLRRAQALSGLDLTDPDTRLLTGIQLVLGDHRT